MSAEIRVMTSTQYLYVIETQFGNSVLASDLRAMIDAAEADYRQHNGIFKDELLPPDVITVSFASNGEGSRYVASFNSKAEAK